MEELRDKLLDWAKQFETPDFIKDDPIFFPHKYNDKKDIEISAFLTSWIAFGNRKLIMQQAEILDNLMGNSPYAFIMNKVWEIGRLTKEPEIRYISKKNGKGEEESTVTASYTLAVARGYRHEDGQQDADFFRCVAFGKNAEFAEKYLHRGTKIAISGHLHSGSYTNKDGVKVYTVNIVVEQHEFAESKRDQISGENAGEIDMDAEFHDVSTMPDEELPFR